MELFYNGTTEFTSDTIDIANNTQSSIADLLILHQREIEVLNLVLESNIGISVVVEKELATDGFSIKTILDSDILHPIDSWCCSSASTWSSPHPFSPSLQLKGT